MFLIIFCCIHNRFQIDEATSKLSKRMRKSLKLNEPTADLKLINWIEYPNNLLQIDHVNANSCSDSQETKLSNCTKWHDVSDSVHSKLVYIFINEIYRCAFVISIEFLEWIFQFITNRFSSTPCKDFLFYLTLMWLLNNNVLYMKIWQIVFSKRSVI